MINMSRLGVLPPLPLTRELYSTCFSKWNVQSGQQVSYIPSGRNDPGEYLYDRTLYPVLSPQIYMINHRPIVSSFLWQRGLLNNRQQRNTALNNYLFALSAWGRDIPQLTLYAQGRVGSFTPVGYDLLCQPDGFKQPVSIFSLPQGRALYWEYEQQYSMNVRIDSVVLSQYQKIARIHHDYLANQLKKNTQQLMFNGAYPFTPTQPLPLYSVQDVIRHSLWLQAPEQYSPPLLKAYKPAVLDDTSDLLFMPSTHAEKAMSVHEGTPTVGRQLTDHKGPAFARCFHHFPQPVSPPGAVVTHKQGVGFDESLPKVVSSRHIGSHPSYVKEIPDNPFMKEQYVPGRKIMTLEGGMSCLAGRGGKGGKRKPDSRERLDNLFNDGQGLFGSSSYSINKETTLQFIELFRDAVSCEIKKNNQKKLEKQKQKKQERLKALNNIKTYVETLSDSDEIKLRLAVQLCGRVRERSQIHQLSQRYCGGFAILQALWGQQPLRAVQVILRLAEHGTARIEDKHGDIKRLRVPEDCPLEQLATYREALADILPLCTLYNCTDHKAATVKDDAINAIKLGLAPMLYRKTWRGTITGLVRKKQNKLFLDALYKTSKCGIPVRGGIGPRFYDYLKRVNINKRLRKPGFFRKVVGRIKDWWSGEGTGHAIIFENFRDQGENIEFKVYTWGRSQRLVMNKELFLSLIDKRRFLIPDITPMDSSNKPKRLGRFVDVHYLMAKKKL